MLFWFCKKNVGFKKILLVFTRIIYLQKVIFKMANDEAITKKEYVLALRKTYGALIY